MAEKSCYFCHKSTHVSENCQNFPTFRSRYSKVFERGQSSCLCLKYVPISEENSMCECKIICELCFQHHHIAMCPKRDPEYPSTPISLPESLCLFSHHSPFARRFFELCSPFDQFKLQKSCKYYKHQQAAILKFLPEYCSDQPLPSSNVVLNHCGIFKNEANIALALSKIECHISFDNISLEKCYITKEDLKILAKNDPYAVALNNCKFKSELEFQEFLDTFPYAFRFRFTEQYLSENFLLNFLCCVRNVGLREIIIQHDYYSMDFEIDDLILLYEQNENLVITIEAYDMPQNFMISQLRKHFRFIEADSQRYDLCCNFKKPRLMLFFRLNNIVSF